MIADFAFLDQDILITRQSALSSALLTLIVPPPISSTSPPAPKPGRPARAILARIIVALYTRGESKELFDVVQQLLRATTGNGETRGAMFEKEKEWRVASCKVLGQVMGSMGQQVRFIPGLGHSTRHFADCIMFDRVAGHEFVH